MNSGLPDDIVALRQATREVVDRLLQYEPQFAETGEVPPQVEETLRELGYLGLTIPEEYGGMGAGTLAACVVFEELGRMPMAFFTSVRGSNSIGSRALVHWGTEEQRRRWLPGIASGEIITAFALSEPNAGSDAANIQATARREGDNYYITGTKHFITNGHRADLITVIAYTDRSLGASRGVTCFMVEPAKTTGFKVRSLQRTMAGPPHCQAVLDFDDCVVPKENVVGGEGRGFWVAMGTLDEGRLHVAAVALGMAQAAMEQSISYAKQRVAFGKPIAEHQAIQHKIADMATQIYAGRQMLYHACRLHEEGHDIHRQAAMVKLFCTEAAWRIVDEAVQIHGGMGYMHGVPVERMYRDVRLLRIVEGTSEIQRRIIARGLLRD